MDERRQVPRWQIQQKARVKIGQQGEFVDCVIEDLGFKGLCISLSKQLPPQDQLRVFLDFPEQLHLDVGVSIPWSRQEQGRYVYGMSFNTIMDENKEGIYQYLSHNFPKQFQKKWWQEGGSEQ